jgi:HlyD family secretion protein
MKAVRTILTILLVVGVIAAAIFVYQRYQQNQAAAASDYQTLAVTRGSLTATIGATGTVRANQTAIITWQTSGSVDQVNAAVGDQVSAEDVLATLSKTSLAQNIILAEADLVTATRNLENLKNSDVTRAQAQVALTNAQKAYDDALNDRNRLDNSRGSAEKIASARAQYYLAEDEVKRFQGIYDTFSGRPEDDAQRALALTNLEAAKTRRDKALINLNWYLGHPSEADYTEADAKLSLAEAQLADAQREWDRLKDGPDPEDIAAAQARVDALSATLRLQQLTAPFNGTITQVNIKAGDQVNQTTQAFRLDDLSRLLVDLQLSEVDINRVKVGQQVSLTFDAIADQSYTGQVVQVARVGTAAQGAVNFGVTIELDNADESVLPGMTAAVNIVVEQLDNVLLVPNRAIRFRNNQRVVYLNVPGGAPRAVEIELGASSDTESQIISDQIKEGDEIVLNPPTELFTPGNGQIMGR